MAYVKKCDICGNVYGNNGHEKTIEMHVIDDEFVSFEGSNNIDCCPDCTNRILNFVNIMKSSKL